MAKKAAKKTPAASSAAKVSVEDQLKSLRGAVERYEALWDEVNVFLEFVRNQRDEQKEADLKVAETKAAYEAAKAEAAAVRDTISGAKDSLFKMLEPGTPEILPLFDRMEPADEEKHGANAEEWRKEPIAALRLSPRATELLLAADVILVGQLQDRIQANADWWESIDGMTLAVGMAIADRLNDFIFDETKK